MKEARRVVGLILAQGDLFVAELMATMGPVDRQIKRLAVPRIGKAHG